MNWTAELRSRFDRAGVTPPDDVIAELADHAATTFAAALASGADEGEARRRVGELIDLWCREPDAYLRRTRRAPAIVAPPAAASGFGGLWLDVVYAVRLLRRQPGTTLLALVTTMVAVGATTTLSSVAYGVLARPLPWPDADRLVRVFESREGSSRRAMPILTNAAYHAWLAEPSSIEALAGFTSGTVTVGGPNEAERVQRTTASASLFDVLRTVPVEGRLFTADDERDEAAVAVVSHRWWQRRLASSSTAVGERLILDGTATTIIGVLPSGFDFPDKTTEIWTPMRISPVDIRGEGYSVAVAMFNGIARLAPGATASQAADEATRLTRAGPSLGMVGVAVFGGDGPAVITARPLAEVVTGDVRPALLMLLVGVGLLFATAIAGLTTLQVASWLARHREMAVRAAIGAGHGRLMRQALMESLVISLTGGALGLLFTVVLHQVTPSVLPAEFPRLDAIRLDWRIAAIAMGLSVAAGLLSSLLPMARVGRLPLAQALSNGGRTSSGPSFNGSLFGGRSVVIVAEVALTVILLVGAGLVTRSFLALGAVDHGYEPDGLLTARLAAGPGRRSAEARQALAAAVAARVEGLPGVRRAAFSSALPLMGGATLASFEMTPNGGTPARQAQAEIVLGSNGLVEALGMHVIEGRGFDRRDTATSQPSIVVTRAFAKEYLGDRAVGTTLPLALGPEAREWTVVGVVGDLTRPVVTDAPPPQVYMLVEQLGRFSVGDFKLAVRTTGDPLAIAPALQTIVREADSTATVESIRTMSDRLSANHAQPRLNALLLGGFAGFSLLVAGVGLFGVLSQGVTSRRRELGVRLALGATPRGIVRLVVLQGVGLAGAGLAVGLVASAWLAGGLESLLYGVTARDPMSYAAVAIAVLGASALACLVPARRAASVDPLLVLRD